VDAADEELDVKAAEVDVTVGEDRVWRVEAGRTTAVVGVVVD